MVKKCWGHYVKSLKIFEEKRAQGECRNIVNFVIWVEIKKIKNTRVLYKYLIYYTKILYM
jgi:hypothetical protein